MGIPLDVPREGPVVAAPRPPRLVAVGAGAHRADHADAQDVDAVDRPSGLAGIEVLAFLTSLVDDPRTGLAESQRAAARAELRAVIEDATIDAIREDPTFPVADLPGRSAVSALRIIVARGLVVDEWNT